MKRKGWPEEGKKRGRVTRTGRSSRPLQGGCLGVDTPVNLFGRSHWR